MSFGWSASDVATLVQLAYRTVQNSTKACGEHDELTREVAELHAVLRRLRQETQRPESPINRPGETCRDELNPNITGSRKLLKTLNEIILQNSALKGNRKGPSKLWQHVKFGNGKMGGLPDLRSKALYYTSALSFQLNMITMGSVGRVEKQMDQAGGDLRKIRLAVNDITALMMVSSLKEGSVLTTYTDDDKAVWKDFRRELVKDGLFPSSVIKKHKHTIKAYIEELASRGILDENVDDDSVGPSVAPGPSTSHSNSTFTIKCLYRRSDVHQKHEASVPSHDSQGHMDDRGKEIFMNNTAEAYSESVCSYPSHRENDPQLEQVISSNTNSQHAKTSCNEPHVTLDYVGHWYPELVSPDFMNYRPLCHYEEFQPNTQSNTEGVFVATPWGLCFVVENLNVSFILEEFKYQMGLILDCLSQDLSSLTENESILKHDSLDLQLDIETLLSFAQSGTTVMEKLVLPKSMQLPYLTLDLENVTLFCEYNLQALVDEHPVTRKENMDSLGCEMASWSLDFEENYMDVVPRILKWKNRNKNEAPQRGLDGHQYPSPDDPSQFRSWKANKSINSTPSGLIAARLAIVVSYQAELQGGTRNFIESPPSDSRIRECEYKRLSECILQPVLMSLDGVETNGDEVSRLMRKNAVKDATLDALGVAHNRANKA